MAIGKSSRRSSTRSSIHAPKFLDKSNGFYGRLDEPAGDEMKRRTEDGQDGDIPGSGQVPGGDEKQEVETFDCVMEDDCETLLRRKPSRLSSRWRRSSRRKQRKGEREDELEPKDERSSLGTERIMGPPEKVKDEVKVNMEMEEANPDGQMAVVVHFQVREDADDQVLIRDKNTREEEETEEERRMKKEQGDGVKAVKKNSAKNYRKALDRAFRRGWETFVTNLYSITLTPVTSSSSQPTVQQM